MLFINLLYRRGVIVDMKKNREMLGSRLGFLLLSAGCAIGLGNVWRFPYIAGEYGGGAFVLIYLVFLFALGIPILAMEFSVGRASKQSIVGSFKTLQKPGQKWHIYGYIGAAGNYILMMFYVVVAGWFLAYLFGMIKGDFNNLTPDEVGNYFGALVSNPIRLEIWMVIVVVLGFFVCSMGLRKGVEKITKIMMLGLFFLILILVVRSVSLEGAAEGLKFYLVPDFEKMMEAGIWEVVYAALGQAFFTLSIGIGSMAIFGSYLSDDKKLTGEAINVTLLDTSVAIMAGLIIFPACFAFGVNPGQGSGLVFVTLPNIFNEMPGSQIWGTLFFLFMVFAALSTVIAVFENIVSICMDKFNWSRKKACIINTFVIVLLATPTVLGFNILGNFAPLGEGTVVLDLLDFIVSNNLLPIGSIIYLLFCVTRYGWGWDNFTKEANKGTGLDYPKWIRPYVTYVIPIICLIIFIQGYLDKFFL